MRIFVAGASGVIGIRLLPLLVAAGHEIAGMTPSPGRLAALEALGAEPVLCDAYDAPTLRAAVLDSGPGAVGVGRGSARVPHSGAVVPRPRFRDWLRRSGLKS
jgi:uncharacterized protein YbjT (DUF2867 family)